MQGSAIKQETPPPRHSCSLRCFSCETTPCDGFCRLHCLPGCLVGSAQRTVVLESGSMFRSSNQTTAIEKRGRYVVYIPITVTLLKLFSSNLGVDECVVVVPNVFLRSESSRKPSNEKQELVPSAPASLRVQSMQIWGDSGCEIRSRSYGFGEKPSIWALEPSGHLQHCK